MPEQLDSIAAQDHRDWTLLACDDQSTDDKVEIVRNFTRRVGDPRVNLVPSRQQGMARASAIFR